MSNYSVYLNNKEVDKALIESLTLKSDIFSLFITGTLICHNLADKLFNSIKSGMEVTIDLEDDLESASEIKFRVINFNKVPGSSNIIDDTLELDLISSYYFDSPIGNQCFEGPVSSVVIDLLETYYVSKYFSSSTLEALSEDTSAIRYQVFENRLKFIERILKYGRYENTPFYLFHDFYNRIRFSSIAQLINSNIQYTLIAPMAEINSTVTTDTTTPIILDGFRFLSNLDHSASVNTTIFGNYLTIDLNKNKIGNPLGTKISIANSEVGNSQCSVLTPQKIYFGNWYRTSSDSLSIAIKDNFEKSAFAYGAIAISKKVLFSAFNTGGLVSLNVSGSTSSDGYILGNGDYLIKSCEIKFYRPELQQTRLELIQARYSTYKSN